jgi:hypothetical protein
VSPNTDDERDRGILSPVDREYLRDPDAFSRQGGYQRRDAIRERIADAFIDFRLLFDHVDDEAINDVFSVEKRGRRETAIEREIPDAKRAMSAVIAFLGRVSMLTDANVDPEYHVETSLQPLVSTTERGIEELLGQKYGLTGDIDVSVSAENMRKTDDLAAELREREIPPEERLNKAAELARAGYSDAEIADILGDPER